MTRQEEQNDILLDCTTRFDELGIDYMLTGSMALVHYAIPRSTADIDIVLDIYPKHVDRFVEKFEDDYLVEKSRVQQAVYARRLFNVLHQEVIIKVDCVVRKDDEYSRNAFKNRRRVQYTRDFAIWIVSKEDLVLSKLNWAKESRSEFQMRDVTSILMNSFDEDYIRTWAKRLDVEEMFDECLARTGDHYA